jgi:uncharacterized protein YggE
MGAQAQERFITVMGVGEVEAAPDMATLQIGVVEQSRTAAEAARRMGSAAQAVLDALARAGIPDENIQTSTLDLRALRQRGTGNTGQTPEIIGFEAETLLSIDTDDIAGLGALFDAVLQAGGNRVNGISFGLQDHDIAMDEARTRAVEDALSKARLYAGAAGVGLGRVLQISEPGTGPRPEMAGRMFAADAGIPIAPGNLRLSAQVTVTVAIAD